MPAQIHDRSIAASAGSALALAAALAGLAAAPGTAAAQTPGPQGKVTILGAGARACASWVEDRTANGAEARNDAAWVEGYLSALASVLPTPDPLVGVKTPAVLLWIDSYCTENQGDPIGRAATALFLEARARASIADSLPPSRPAPRDGQ